MTTTTIPAGSTVLVTGINGYIGSHVADQLLEAGFKVRGTARSQSKAAAVAAVLEARHGTRDGALEIVVVRDMEHEGAFDEAVKDVSGIVHVASVMTFAADPNEVVPGTLKGLQQSLRSAAKEASVKRFVYTSSSSACCTPNPGAVFDITKESWNEAAVEAAWLPPPYEAERAMMVYSASKTQAERELWRFMAERRRHFVANAVLPNANFGPKLEPTQPGSTANWVLKAYQGDLAFAAGIRSQYFVDVRDTARLHVAALVNESVQGERVFAFAEPFSWGKITEAIKAARPKYVATNVPEADAGDCSRVVERPRAEALLRELGRPGFTSLGQSISDALDAEDRAPSL